MSKYYLRCSNCNLRYYYGKSLIAAKLFTWFNRKENALGGCYGNPCVMTIEKED